MGYTKIPNWLLDSPNDLTHAEERVLMRIHRLITGYHILAGRNISYALITKMSGVKKVSPIMQSLRKNGIIGYQSNNGKISEIKILEPNTLGNLTIDLRSSQQLPEVNGSRRFKENFKENIKESRSLPPTIPKNLIQEMKSKYPDKDINHATNKFIAFFINQSYSTEFLIIKYREWCQNEKMNNSHDEDWLQKMDQKIYGESKDA